MRRALVAAALSLALVSVAQGATAKLYPGSSQDLAPTASEIGFTTVAAFSKAKHPTGALSPGYKSGVSAIYTKGTAKAPNEALAIIYVYKTAADALRSWKYTCSKCKVGNAPDGLHFKAEAGTSSSLLVLKAIDTCANVYFNISIEGSEGATKLESDDATIASAIYERALHFGLSSCSAK
jgi:hypothetical protein